MYYQQQGELLRNGDYSMFGSIQNFLMFIFCSPKSKLTESLLMFRAEFYDTVNVKNQEMQRLRDLYAEPK